MQAWIPCSGIFIVTLSFSLGIIYVVLLNECTVVHFDEFFCVVSQKFPGVSSSTTHLTSTSQPNSTTTSVTLTTQPTKTSQTVTPTTASPGTSPQGNSTVVTTSKPSSTSVTGEFTVQEAHKGSDARSPGL